MLVSEGMEEICVGVDNLRPGLGGISGQKSQVDLGQRWHGLKQLLVIYMQVVGGMEVEEDEDQRSNGDHVYKTMFASTSSLASPIDKLLQFVNDGWVHV